MREGEGHSAAGRSIIERLWEQAVLQYDKLTELHDETGGVTAGNLRDWLDNNGKPSADRIVPEWQDLEVGQHVARTAAPGREPGTFTVVALDPNRTLVLRSTYGLFTGRDLDPRSGPGPAAWVDGIWGFHLSNAPGGATRLVARSRSRGRPSLLSRSLNLLLGEPLHFAMQTRQFHNLRRRTAGDVS